MADRVQQVGLAQPGVAVDEQRVVGLGRRLGHRDRGRVGEPVARADDERLEQVARVEPGRLALPPGTRLAAGAGDVARPRLVACWPRSAVVGLRSRVVLGCRPWSAPSPRARLLSLPASVLVSRLGSTTTAIRRSRPSCSDSTAVMTWRSRDSMTSLANSLGTASSAVSSTTPSSRLSRMNARCWRGDGVLEDAEAPLPDLEPSSSSVRASAAPTVIAVAGSSSRARRWHRSRPVTRWSLRGARGGTVFTFEPRDGDASSSDVPSTRSSTACVHRLPRYGPLSTSPERAPMTARTGCDGRWGSGPATGETLTRPAAPPASGCPQPGGLFFRRDGRAGRRVGTAAAG